MSSMAALVILAAAASVPVPAAPQEMRGAKPFDIATAVGRPASSAPGCASSPAGPIIVCGHGSRPSPRLPLPDERGARAAVRDTRADAAAAFEARLGCRMGCDPRESAEKGARLIRIIRGEDPDG